MPRIRCHYLDCLFLDERYCSAAAIELSPDSGCLTYVLDEDAETAAVWDNEEIDDWDDLGGDEESEDLWAVADEEDEDPDDSDTDDY